MPTKGNILGYDVDLLTKEDALTLVYNKMDRDEGMHIVTINPEIIERGLKDSALDKVLKSADLTIPDGVGIQIALKINEIIQERIPGIEFAQKIIERCVQMQYPVAFLGAKEETLQMAIENLENKYSKIKIVYQRNGFFGEDEEADIVDKIESTSPKVLLVALGSPKQDFFISKYKNRLKNVIMIGVGGSFDVWSGNVKRAPQVFQKLGCEWLYRTLVEPSRFKRIFPTLPLFLFRVILEKKKREKQTNE